MTSPDSRRHSWGEPSRPTRFKTERQCDRCGLVKVTRHEGAPGSPGESHWTEWYAAPSLDGEPGDRIDAPDGRTPPCEPVDPGSESGAGRALEAVDG